MANSLLPRQPLNNLAPFQMQTSPVGNEIVTLQVITQAIVFSDGTVQTTAAGHSGSGPIDVGTF